MLNQIDKNLFLLINGLSNSALDVIMGTFSFAGDFYIVIPVTALFVLIKNRENSKRDIITALVCLFTGGLIVYFLKGLIARPRPLEELGEIVRIIGKGHSSSSFPSGHSQMSFGAVTFLWLRYKKWALSLFFLGFLCAVSRVYCGMHFPSDILAGSAIGITSSWVAYRIFERHAPMGLPHL